jgi:predicted RNase H-like HicB family nuclease
MEMFVYTGIIWKDENGFSALCPELDIASQGSTTRKARQMLLEAATLHLEGTFEDGLPYLRPVPTSEDPRSTLPADSLEIFRFKVDVAVRAHA